jgi:hypothetical protein
MGLPSASLTIIIIGTLICLCIFSCLFCNKRPSSQSPKSKLQNTSPGHPSNSVIADLEAGGGDGLTRAPTYRSSLGAGETNSSPGSPRSHGTIGPYGAAGLNGATGAFGVFGAFGAGAATNADVTNITNPPQVHEARPITRYELYRLRDPPGAAAVNRVGEEELQDAPPSYDEAKMGADGGRVSVERNVGR